jgi:outer membrane murein-binding lipoprotein Lpp
MLNLVLSGVVGGALGMVGGYLGMKLRREFVRGDINELSARLEILEAEVKSLRMARLSAKGVAAREEQSAEVQLAMAELGGAVSEGGTIDPSKIAELVAKYPGAAKFVMRRMGLKL